MERQCTVREQHCSALASGNTAASPSSLDAASVDHAAVPSGFYGPSATAALGAEASSVSLPYQPSNGRVAGGPLWPYGWNFGGGRPLVPPPPPQMPAATRHVLHSSLPVTPASSAAPVKLPAAPALSAQLHWPAVAGNARLNDVPAADGRAVVPHAQFAGAVAAGAYTSGHPSLSVLAHRDGYVSNSGGGSSAVGVRYALPHSWRPSPPAAAPPDMPVRRVDVRPMMTAAQSDAPVLLDLTRNRSSDVLDLSVKNRSTAWLHAATAAAAAVSRPCSVTPRVQRPSRPPSLQPRCESVPPSISTTANLLHHASSPHNNNNGADAAVAGCVGTKRSPPSPSPPPHQLHDLRPAKTPRLTDAADDVLQFVGEAASLHEVLRRQVNGATPQQLAQMFPNMTAADGCGGGGGGGVSAVCLTDVPVQSCAPASVVSYQSSPAAGSSTSSSSSCCSGYSGGPANSLISRTGVGGPSWRGGAVFTAGQRRTLRAQMFDYQRQVRLQTAGIWRADPPSAAGGCTSAASVGDHSSVNSSSQATCVSSRPDIDRGYQSGLQQCARAAVPATSVATSSASVVPDVAACSDTATADVFGDEWDDGDWTSMCASLASNVVVHQRLASSKQSLHHAAPAAASSPPSTPVKTESAPATDTAAAAVDPGVVKREPGVDDKCETSSMAAITQAVCVSVEQSLPACAVTPSASAAVDSDGASTTCSDNDSSPTTAATAPATRSRRRQSTEDAAERRRPEQHLRRRVRRMRRRSESSSALIDQCAKKRRLRRRRRPSASVDARLEVHARRRRRRVRFQSDSSTRPSECVKKEPISPLTSTPLTSGTPSKVHRPLRQSPSPSPDQSGSFPSVLDELSAFCTAGDCQADILTRYDVHYRPLLQRVVDLTCRQAIVTRWQRPPPSVTDPSACGAHLTRHWPAGWTAACRQWKTHACRVPSRLARVPPPLVPARLVSAAASATGACVGDKTSVPVAAAAAGTGVGHVDAHQLVCDPVALAVAYLSGHNRQLTADWNRCDCVDDTASAAASARLASVFGKVLPATAAPSGGNCWSRSDHTHPCRVRRVEQLLVDCIRHRLHADEETRLSSPATSQQQQQQRRGRGCRSHSDDRPLARALVSRYSQLRAGVGSAVSVNGGGGGGGALTDVSVVRLLAMPRPANINADDDRPAVRQATPAFRPASARRFAHLMPPSTATLTDDTAGNACVDVTCVFGDVLLARAVIARAAPHRHNHQYDSRSVASQPPVSPLRPSAAAGVLVPPTPRVRRRRRGRVRSGLDYMIKRKRRPRPPPAADTAVSSPASVNSTPVKHRPLRLTTNPCGVNRSYTGITTTTTSLTTTTTVAAMTTAASSCVTAEIRSWMLNKSAGESALLRAAKLGHESAVLHLLHHDQWSSSSCTSSCSGASSVAACNSPDDAVNTADHAGFTALHEACARGHVATARLLLMHGARVDTPASGGVRPLHEAAENGNVEMVRLLLSYGADPRTPTYAGSSAIQLASTAAEASAAAANSTHLHNHSSNTTNTTASNCSNSSVVRLLRGHLLDIDAATDSSDDDSDICADAATNTPHAAIARWWTVPPAVSMEWGECDGGGVLDTQLAAAPGTDDTTLTFDLSSRALPAIYTMLDRTDTCGGGRVVALASLAAYLNADSCEALLSARPELAPLTLSLSCEDCAALVCHTVGDQTQPLAEQRWLRLTRDVETIITRQRFNMTR